MYYYWIIAEIVGMCAGSMTRSDTAFMGFYAIEPRYQKAGIGRELWARTVGRLEPSINIGLYGVPTMSEKYKKSGFILEDSIRMLIFESQPNEEDKLKINELKDIDEFHCCHIEIIDSNSSELLFKKLIDYDHSVQKFSREKILTYYLRGNDVPITLAIVRDLNKSKSCSHPACDQHYASSINERKSSCCAKPSQESIIEDETLSTTTKSSLSISPPPSQQQQQAGSTIINSTNDHSSPTETYISSTTTTSITNTEQSQHTTADSNCGYEILGYGSIRLDNNSGGIVGPIYADSSDLCEVLLRNLINRFELKEGSIYSVMALSSNKQACKILTKIGLQEMEQCSRMFTKFVPAASLSKVYYVHSPNFTLF